MWKHSSDTRGLLFRALQGHMSTPKQLFTLTAFSKESIIGLDLFISGGGDGLVCSRQTGGPTDRRSEGEYGEYCWRQLADGLIMTRVRLCRAFSVAAFWFHHSSLGYGENIHHFNRKSLLKRRNYICKKTILRPLRLLAFVELFLWKLSIFQLKFSLMGL